MSWKSARLVLIITYSVIAVLFAIVIAFFGIRAYVIESKTINNIKTVLSDNDISISDSVDLKQKNQASFFTLENIAYNNDEVANRFLGADCTKISDNYFKNGHRQLRITGSRILYENTAEREAIKGSVDVQEQVNNFLADLSFNENEYAVYNISLNNGFISFEAVPKYKKYWVHGAGFKATADRNGVFNLEGIWFESPKANSEKIRFCKPTSVLVNLAHIEDAKGKTVDKIYANFYIEEKDILNDFVIPIPMYVIKCTDGSEYKFNAENAKLYTGK